MALKFSSPNISQDVQDRTQQFFDLIKKNYKNYLGTEELKLEVQARKRNLINLVKDGIDVNAKVLGDLTGMPLLWAVRVGFINLVKALIEANADVNAQIHHNTPLEVAISTKKNKDIFETLITAGANIYFADDEGNITKDLIRERLSEDDYNTIIVAGESFYAEFAKGKYPDTVEDVLKLVAFHPISPSDNREPFPKIDILRKILIGSWDLKKTRLKKVEGLIDALKDRGTINETECAQLKDACLYKIAAPSTHKRQNRAKTESELAR